MCQYSAVTGMANGWHLTHLASRAVGGAGLVFTEAAAVTAEGRISPADLGLWSDVQAEAMRPVAAAIAAAGAVTGMQLEVGRVTCRDRVCPYVWIEVVAVFIIKQIQLIYNTNHI